MKAYLPGMSGKNTAFRSDTPCIPAAVAAHCSLRFEVAAEDETFYAEAAVKATTTANCPVSLGQHKHKTLPTSFQPTVMSHQRNVG